MDRDDKKFRRIQRAMIVIAMMTNFINTFAASSVAIAAPHIGSEFHVSATSLTWVVIAYVAPMVICSIPFGRLADMRGRPLILKRGLVLVLASAVLSIVAPSMEILLITRVVQGVGAAMIFATNAAITIEAFPAEKRGSVLGLLAAGLYAGNSCGPVIGGVITHAFSWRFIFIVVAVFALIPLIASSQIQKASKKIAQANGSIGFRDTLEDIARLFRGNRPFTFSNIATIFNYASTYAIAYQLSIYLQLVRGYNADFSGIIMIFQPIVQTIVSPLAGRLSDRKSPSLIASVGMACSGCALLMFSFLSDQTPLPFIIAGLFLTGLGFGLFASPNSNVILSSVPREEYSMASSIMGTSRTIGQASAMIIIALVVNAVVGNIPLTLVAPESIVTDTRITFLIFAGLSFIGAVISLNRQPKGSL